MNPIDTLLQYKQYLMPWYNTGLGDFQTFSNVGQRMAQNPVDYTNQIMNQYQMSPFAQQQQNYISQAVANQAAKGGYLGTPQEMTDLQGNLNRLIAGDQQQYFQDVMQPQQMGLNVLGQGSQLGFGATRELGDMYANMAQLEAAAQAAHSSMLGNLLGVGLGGAMKFALPLLAHGLMG